METEFASLALMEDLQGIATASSLANIFALQLPVACADLVQDPGSLRCFRQAEGTAGRGMLSQTMSLRAAIHVPLFQRSW